MGQYKTWYTFPVLLSIFFYYWPECLIMIMPVPLDNWLLQKIWPPHSNPNDPDYWAADPILAEVLPTKINELKDIIHPKGYPVVVENYVDALDFHSVIKPALLEANRGKQIRVLDFGLKTALNESHMSNCAAGGPFQEDPVYINFEEFISNMEDMDDLYAGFETITPVETVNELLGGFDFTKLVPGYKQNNLFFANFRRTLLSAGFHCAPIDSIAIQLVGKKTWFLASPEQLARLISIPLPTFFGVGLNDDDLIDQIKEFKIVQAGPGDALYFGPNWCHAVITHQGPNIMFNLRYDAWKKFKKGPLSLLLKVIFRTFTRTFGANPQENTETQGPIYKTLTQMFDDCGPSNRLEELVARFAKDDL